VICMCAVHMRISVSAANEALRDERPPCLFLSSHDARLTQFEIDWRKESFPSTMASKGTSFPAACSSSNSLDPKKRGSPSAVTGMSGFIQEPLVAALDALAVSFPRFRGLAEHPLIANPLP
jgi:hypothetical protein